MVAYRGQGIEGCLGCGKLMNNCGFGSPICSDTCLKIYLAKHSEIQLKKEFHKQLYGTGV